MQSCSRAELHKGYADSLRRCSNPTIPAALRRLAGKQNVHLAAGVRGPPAEMSAPAPLKPDCCRSPEVDSTTCAASSSRRCWGSRNMASAAEMPNSPASKASTPGHFTQDMFIADQQKYGADTMCLRRRHVTMSTWFNKKCGFLCEDTEEAGKGRDGACSCTAEPETL